MKELLRTTDAVLLTFVAALLRDAGISAMIADVHISAVEGSIGAFPRRVLVEADRWRESISILNDAGLSEHLPADQRRPTHSQP